MTAKHFRDNAGAYLGGFDGAAPPAGAVEVPTPPEHASQQWDGAAWQDTPETTAWRADQAKAGNAIGQAELIDLLLTKGVISQAEIDARKG